MLIIDRKEVGMIEEMTDFSCLQCLKPVFFGMIASVESFVATIPYLT